MSEVINQKNINDILEKANKMKYTSLKYVSKDDLLNSYVYTIKKDIIVLGKQKDDKLQIFWACESQQMLQQSLAHLIKGEDAVYIEFIPQEFVNNLGEIGFKIESHFLDFWLKDLNDLKINAQKSQAVIDQIAKNELQAVSEVSKMCNGLSRGFAGSDWQDTVEWFNNENSIILKATINNEIVGTAYINLYGFDSERGIVLWLKMLAVNPEYHRQGIAHDLIYNSLNWGLMNKAKRSFLSSDKQNINAIKLYEQVGYKRDSDYGQINMMYRG